MIIDVSFIQEYNEAEQAATYSGLIAVCQQIPEDYYKQLNIYVEKHQIIPSFEKENSITIFLPLSIHFKAHILRARESINKKFMIGNYTEAYKIMNGKYAEEIKIFYQKEIEEAKQHYQKWFKQNLNETTKEKIKWALFSLDKNIILKRNLSIQKYAEKRPEVHNQNISRGRQKSIIDLQTGLKYKNALECSKALGVSISTLRKHCQKRIFNSRWVYEFYKIPKMQKNDQENHEDLQQKNLDI